MLNAAQRFCTMRRGCDRGLAIFPVVLSLNLWSATASAMRWIRGRS